MVNSKDFSKRLEKILEYYSISATVFSEEIDFNRSTISHLLSGRNKPSLEFVMKVLQKFPEVELHWLLNGKGFFPAQATNAKMPLTNSKMKNDLKTEKNADLFSALKENIPKSDSTVIKNFKSTSEIDKIVIFYTDGTFKAYEN